MRVLLACEMSGVVRDAFRRRGHDAWSCDILPCAADPTFHIQADVTTVLGKGWDMMIAFPPCTDLSSVGAKHWPAKRADGRQQRAVDFFLSLAHDTRIPLRAVENPSGWMCTCYRKPDQYIHPWHFGYPVTKRTGLWLYGLPPLTHTTPVRPINSWMGITDIPAYRSWSFPCIGEAMADQWGDM